MALVSNQVGASAPSSSTSSPFSGSSLAAKASELERLIEDITRAVHLERDGIESKLEDLQLISREKTADLLNLSLSQVDRLAKSGHLPSVIIDRRPRYRLISVKAFIESRTKAPSKQGHIFPALRAVEHPQTKKR